VDASPETWRWIWLGAAVFLTAGEMAIPGSFILIPFGISAFVAMIAALAGANIAAGWTIFVVLGTLLFCVFWRISARSMRDMPSPEGAGEARLIGAAGSVLETIPDSPSGSGLVAVGAEKWRAVTDGTAIDVGTQVTVTGVKGTRVIVASLVGDENSTSISEPTDKET